MGIMGGSGSKAPAGPSRRRKTRSSTAAEAEAKQREERASQPHEEAVASPSKKAKVSDEAELSREMALAKALEAMSEEQSAEEADQKSSDQVPASAEVLVTIPDAKVQLIEEEGSAVTLASGAFSITRIHQNGNVVAVFAKVGDELQWPLAKDEPALKLKDGYYIFTLRLPVSVDEEEADEQQNKEGDAEAEGSESVKPDPGILNYGVIFHADKYQEPLKELDNILENYSAFVPVPALKEEEVEGSIVEELGSEQQQGGAARPKKSDYYYKQLAPNVDDYNTALARSIASGTGQVIKGILWVSEVIATQIERSGLFMQKRIKPKTTPSKISPKTMKNIQRAKKVSKMTENLASGMLSGVITATGSITSSLLRSKPAAKLFGMLPGEAALASLDAFVKVFEALELAGKNVLSRTSFVTCQVVSHRYGDEAAALTKEGLSTAGHVVTTAWTISKIRTAIDPTKASKNPIFIKAAASAAAEELKDKKQT